MPRNWYAATTRPLQEQRAERELRKQGFFVYSPKVRLRRAGGYIVRPYLRGYVLVRFDPVADWRWPSINGTRGVGRLLMTGEVPSRIRRGVVESILSTFGDGFITDDRKFDELILHPGDRVFVVGMSQGVVISSSHDKVRLMLEAFGGQVEAVVNKNRVEKQDGIANAQVGSLG